MRLKIHWGDVREIQTCLDSLRVDALGSTSLYRVDMGNKFRLVEKVYIFNINEIIFCSELTENILVLEMNLHILSLFSASHGRASFKAFSYQRTQCFRI